MGSIEDWAARAARYIFMEVMFWNWKEHKHPSKKAKSEARIAAIIATFAEPILTLLHESRREHHHADGDVRDGACCPQCCCESWPDDPEGDFEPEPNSDKPCTCGADEWNRRIEEALR